MLVSGLLIRSVGDTYYRLLIDVERQLLEDGIFKAPNSFFVLLPFLGCNFISVLLVFAKPKHWLFVLIVYPLVFYFALWFLYNGPVFLMEELSWTTIYYHLAVLLTLFLLATIMALKKKGGLAQII